MKNLLDVLRNETSDIHERLHEHPFMLKCLSTGLNAIEYNQLLQVFEAPFTTLVNKIKLVEPANLRPILVIRHNLLLSDLKELDPSYQVNQQINQIAEDNLEFNSAMEVLGSTYALVGSSLGAQQLRTAVTAALDNPPVSYLSQSPIASGWPQLAKYLRAQTYTQKPGVTQGAVKVFEYIANNLPMPSEALETKKNNAEDKPYIYSQI
jgi:heme oxygenase